MTNVELIAKVAADADMTKKDAEKAVNAAVAAMSDALKGGEKIAKEVEAAAPAGRKLVRMRPDGGKDWNQVLQDRFRLDAGQ